MQKKRVRVYKPDNSNKFMYQAGGMAPQGAGMMPSQGQGPDLQSIISTYAQAKGMSGEEANQLYNQIMQMPQDQQQQVIAQLTQELSSTQVPVARYGGDMGSKKRLMKKAIGGVSPNTTMENVVDNRRETVMNAIGANMSRNLVDETYNEAQQAAQTFNPYAQPQMQFGGRSPFYGGMDPNNNPFMDDTYETQSNFKDAMGKLGNSLWNIGATMKPGNIKVKTKGDMFNRTRTQDKNAFFNQDVDENVIPDYLQFDTASAYNPSLGNYQPGGETGGDALTNTLTDLNINTDSYNTAKQAVDNGSYTGDQLEIVNRVNRAQQQLYPNQATNTTTNNTTNATTPSGAINGWHGPYLFKDGKVIDMVDQKQGQQQMGYSPSSFTNQRLDPFAYLNSPQGMQAFGTAMKGFQPDNVHLSKLKGRTGLFGNKFVAKWDYNEDGKGLPAGPNEMPQRTFNFGFNRQDDNYGRFDQAVDRFKENRNLRSGDKLYEEEMGKSPYTVGEKQVERQAPEYNSQLSQTPFGFKGPGTSSQRPMNVNFNIKGENPYAVPQGQTPVQDVPNHTYNYKTGEQEYSGPINAERLDPSTGRSEYFVTQPPNPDYFFSEETGSRGYDLEKGFYASGGTAGKLIIKQGNGLFGNINNMVGASGIIAGMNALSAAKNRTDIDENMTLADSINPVMMDSVDRNPLQQGLWGTGPLTGEEVPNLQPFNQGYRWSQGQGNGLMDQNQFSRYGGKTYQDGGGAATESKAGLYQQALAERDYFLQNPDMWKEDPEMQNEDGSFNLCLDCINVDYNDPNQVQDAARLINEGYSKGTHFSTDAFNEGLKKYNIPAPVYGSAAAKPVVKRTGGGINFYQEGGVYELDQNEVDEIMRNGGSIEYFD